MSKPNKKDLEKALRLVRKHDLISQEVFDRAMVRLTEDQGEIVKIGTGASKATIEEAAASFGSHMDDIARKHHGGW